KADDAGTDHPHEDDDLEPQASADVEDAGRQDGSVDDEPHRDATPLEAVDEPDQTPADPDDVIEPEPHAGPAPEPVATTTAQPIAETFSASPDGDKERKSLCRRVCRRRAD